MDKPLVSIIVPIFNTERFLRECLQSLIMQTMKEIEIICIDDGSTDKSGIIIDKYKEIDERIIAIHKKNEGYGKSMNLGLKIASGDFIGIIESDDFAEHDMIEKLYVTAIRSKAEIVKGNYFQFLGKEKISRNYKENLYSLPYNQCFHPLDHPRIFLAIPSIWSGLYKKDFLISNQIFFLESQGASYQDRGFAYKCLASSSKIYLIKDGVMNYRVDNAASSVKSSKKIFCICDVIQDCKRFLDQDSKAKRELYFILEDVKVISYLWNYFRIASEYQYAFLVQMKKELLESKSDGLLNQEYLSGNNREIVEEILFDMDIFFQKTAKMYQPKDYLGYNKYKFKDWLVEEIEETSVLIIYGAGKKGKGLYNILKKHNVFLKKVVFAVTEKKRICTEEVYPEVKEIQELIAYKKDSLILVATDKKYHDDIHYVLNLLEFVNFIFLDDCLYKILEENGKSN